MKKSTWCFLAAGITILSACHSQEREASVSRFARLYFDLRMASSGMEGHPEKAREARTKVLRSSGIDLVGYRKQLRDLQADPDHWELFWDRVQGLTDSFENTKKKKGP